VTHAKQNSPLSRTRDSLKIYLRLERKRERERRRPRFTASHKTRSKRNFWHSQRGEKFATISHCLKGSVFQSLSPGFTFLLESLTFLNVARRSCWTCYKFATSEGESVGWFEAWKNASRNVRTMFGACLVDYWWYLYRVSLFILTPGESDSHFDTCRAFIYQTGNHDAFLGMGLELWAKHSSDQ